MEYKYMISIIIPMYNAEQYISNCLDSILASSLPVERYEIIVVNDGSTDDGPTIAQMYAQQQVNITYITQANQGLSVARNLGIKKCIGKYVWCIDADDKLDSKELPKVLYTLEKQDDLDILAVQLQRISEQGESISIECKQSTLPHREILTGKQAVIGGYNPSSICALIARKTLFVDNDVFFVPGITHEDVELTYRLMPRAGKVLFSDFMPYLYVNHPDSMSKSLIPQKKIKYVKDDIFIIQSFRALAKSFEVSDPQLACVIYNRSQNVLFSLVYSLYKNRKVWGKLGINEVVLDELKSQKLYPMKAPWDSWKKRMMVACFLNIECFLR